MGMWLSEGYKSARNVGVCQPKNGTGYAEFFSLLRDIRGEDPHYNGDSLVIGHAPLARYLKQFGTASEKFIPEEIMGATRRQIEVFLYHFALGDGSKNRKTLYTSSHKMADQLQELAQKVGLSAAISVDDRVGREAECSGRIVRTNFVNYKVNISGSKLRRFSVDSEQYDGTIGCVSVPNGILYVRRNGKACWSGNTPDQIATYQKYWDLYFSGDAGQKRKAKFVPGGVAKTFIQTQEPDLKAEFDDWLARIVCFAFSVSPQALVKQMNRSSGQLQKATAEEEGLVPVMEWVKELVDQIIEEDLGAPDVCFQFAAEDALDESALSAILDTDVRSGIRSINEARAVKGLDPIPGKEFETPHVYTAMGYVAVDANSDEAVKRRIEITGSAPQTQPGASAPNGTQGKPAEKKPTKTDSTGERPR
jgi:hypothetical protein